MTLANTDAHNTKVVCLITPADSYENVCKLSNQWLTFAERVDDEYQVDLEIGNMKPLAKQIS